MSGAGMTGAPMRRADWQSRLALAVEAARAVPFKWGEHDCATWAFDLRRDLTDGADAAATWRGRYRTAPGAQRVMRRLGWTSFEAMGRDLLGTPLPSVLLAQRGDLVLAAADPATADPAFGVCLGAKAAFIGPQGLGFVSLSTCILAWRV